MPVPGAPVAKLSLLVTDRAMQSASCSVPLLLLLAAVMLRGATAGCPSCGIPKEAEERMLIEMAKQQILSKLHLKERPNITQAVPRPALMAALRRLHAGRLRQDGTLELDSGAQGAGAKEQEYEVVNFADTDDTESSGRRPSLAFQFVQEQGHNMQVLQSSLWLYIHSANPPIRDGTSSAQIYLAGEEDGNLTLVAEKRMDTQRGGWQNFPLTRALQEFLDGEQRTLRLEARCQVGGQELCGQTGFQSDDSQKPFLVARVRLREDEAVGARRRRSLRCGKDVSVCCKKDFYVKFRDIQWQDWIIAPEGYHMNYCVGQCPQHLAGSPGIASSFHASVFSQLKANGIQTAASSCCVPVQRRPLSMVYFNSQHSIEKKDVSDMIVESCGCT